MRFGWMRLRWPTSAAPSAVSRRSDTAPPAFPPIQANPSFSRFSSYSCATLICNMRLPGGDVLVECARVAVGGEFRTKIAVAQDLSELGVHAPVLSGGVLGHEQQKHETHGLAVGGVERHRLGEADEGADRLLQPFDPAVRDGDSLAEPRRAETLAGEETVEHEASRHALVVLEKEPCLLEHALLARHIQVQQDVRGRQ